ncbi:MAG: VPLPA-CTERM sorting domain-containing protein, partial [Paracoccaceae bacterium]
TETETVCLQKWRKSILFIAVIGLTSGQVLRVKPILHGGNVKMDVIINLRQSVAPIAVAAGLALGLAGSASAATISTLDISGVGVDGAAPTVINQLVGAGTINEIFFDFEIEHFFNSWGSETDITIEAPDGSMFSFDGSADFGFAGTSGVFSFIGSFVIADTSALGTWIFSLSDSFDDSPNPDGIYSQGSSIELRGAVIPLPAGLWLSLTALAGLGFVKRRRRKS